MFVRRKDAEHQEARRLRSELGWSVARIAWELGVAKSSVSVWVRDLGPRRSSAGAPPRPPGALPVRRLLVWRSGRLRRCGRCRHELPLECFNRLGDGHQWWCRTCFAAYFRARGELHRDQSKAAKRARTRSLRAHVLEYLRGHPCVDCGESDPVVLEFDHIGDKTAAIAALVSDGAPLKTIDTEIARCEVVCASCHKRRTARRARWRRAGPGNPSRPYATPAIARNFAHLHAILGAKPLRRLRRGRPACPRVRSHPRQARRRHAARMARLQSGDDRYRGRQVRDPMRQLPPARHGVACRPFPVPRLKLRYAPVAQW
jgi:hypothetical protein